MKCKVCFEFNHISSWKRDLQNQLWLNLRRRHYQSLNFHCFSCAECSERSSFGLPLWMPWEQHWVWPPLGCHFHFLQWTIFSSQILFSLLSPKVVSTLCLRVRQVYWAHYCLQSSARHATDKSLIPYQETSVLSIWSPVLIREYLQTFLPHLPPSASTPLRNHSQWLLRCLPCSSWFGYSG